MYIDHNGIMKLGWKVTNYEQILMNRFTFSEKSGVSAEERADRNVIFTCTNLTPISSHLMM